MAADSNGSEGPGLPPKLDLRKSGVLKDGAGPDDSAPAPQQGEDTATTARLDITHPEEPSPGTVKMTRPEELASTPAQVPAEGEASSETMRIEVPEAAAPQMGGTSTPAQKPTAAPRTIKMTRPPELGGPKPLAQPVPAEESGTTMRIDVPAEPAGTVKMQKPGAPAPVATTPGDTSSTMHIQVPEETVPTTIAAKPGTPSMEAKKKETSRIPLGSATVGPAADSPQVATQPKTIRIKPTAGPGAAPAPAGVTDAAGAAVTDKSKTSRISLEAALSPGASEPAAPAAGGGAPKTIRLKRPSEASTIKLSQKPKLGKVEDDGKPSMDKTARLDDAAIEEEADISPTRKRTIRVKRPGGAPSARPASVRKADVDVDEDEDEELEEVEVERHDEPGLFFSILSIFIIIATGVAIYVFCAQTLGPDTSLTQFSFHPTGPDLPWHGKIAPMRGGGSAPSAPVE